jgi:prepilin-type processing-associated H-X9-DG protein
MKCSTISRSERALTLVEIFVLIAVMAVLFLLWLAALPSGPSGHGRADCTNRLKQIGLAFRTWSTDNGDKYPMTAMTNSNGSLELASGSNVFRAFQVMSNELNNPKVLLCPNDNRKLPLEEDFANLKNSNISYFIGLDADETLPAMLLAGDRNLETNGVAAGPGRLVITQTNGIGFTAKIHNRAGNIGLADGSVLQVDIPGLQQLMARSGTNTVRLGMP